MGLMAFLLPVLSRRLSYLVDRGYINGLGLPATDTPCSLYLLHRNTCGASVSASERGPEWIGYQLSLISFSDTDSVDCRVFLVGSKSSQLFNLILSGESFVL
jgi:hypothetical protein